MQEEQTQEEQIQEPQVQEISEAEPEPETESTEESTGEEAQDEIPAPAAAKSAMVADAIASALMKKQKNLKKTPRSPGRYPEIVTEEILDTESGVPVVEAVEEPNLKKKMYRNLWKKQQKKFLNRRKLRNRKRFRQRQKRSRSLPQSQRKFLRRSRSLFRQQKNLREEPAAEPIEEPARIWTRQRALKSLKKKKRLPRRNLLSSRKDSRQILQETK